MFNMKNFKLVKKLKNADSKVDWLNFSDINKKNQKEFLDSVVSDNKFIQEDLKLRAMVKDMIRQEFGSRLDSHKDYEFLVDSVVNKLKKQQMGKIEPIDGI